MVRGFTPYGDYVYAITYAGAPKYKVVRTKLAHPDWEHAEDVGEALSATLKVSKDNVVFAVRALDVQGHRSLSVVPLPER